MQTHCYTTFLLPTRGGQTYRVRKAGQPEECQKEIYRALGIQWEKLPQTKVVVPTKTPVDFVVPKKRTLIIKGLRALVRNSSEGGVAAPPTISIKRARV